VDVTNYICANLFTSGTITFDDGDHEASVEIVVCREIAHREANFRVELVDPYDRVNFAAPSTLVTVIRDKGEQTCDLWCLNVTDSSSISKIVDVVPVYSRLTTFSTNCLTLTQSTRLLKVREIGHFKFFFIEILANM